MSAVLKMADKKFLRSLVPLNGLSATHFEELTRKANVLEIPKNKFLFKKGERDNVTCYVLSGELALQDGADIKLTIQGGTEEAKNPIAPQQPRQLSARAKTPVTIVSIDSGLLDVMLAWEQQSGMQVAEIVSEEEEDWMTRMMQSDLLQKLPAMNLQQLFMRMDEVDVKASEVIVNQDDDGDYYYIIKQGTAIVSRKTSAAGRPIKLAELHNGDSFGEESLLSGGKRNATVTMLTDGQLMRLSKKDFDELLKAPLLAQVSYDEAKAMLDDGASFLDVRLPGEFASGHLPGSINMPLAAIRNEMDSLDQEQIYIVYCDTGRRSASAAFLLGQFGVTAHVLKDGINGVPLEEYTDQAAQPAADNVIDLGREKADAGKTSAEISKLEKQVEQLSGKLGEVTNKLEQAEAEKNTQQERIAKLEQDAEKDKEQIKILESGLLDAQDQDLDVEKLKADIAAKQKSLKEHESRLEILQTAEQRAQNTIDKQQEKLSKLEVQLKEAQEKVREAEQSEEDSINQIDRLQTENKSLQSKSKELTEKLKQLEQAEQDKAAIQHSYDDLKQQHAELENQLEQAQAGQNEQEKAVQEKLAAFEQELANLQTAMADKDQQLHDSEQTADSLRQEVATLTEQLEQARQGHAQQDQTVQDRLAELQAEVERLGKVLEKSDQDLQQAVDEKQTLQQQLDSINARLEEAQNGQQADEHIQNKLTEYETELKSLNQQVQDKDAQLVQAQEDRQALQQDMDKLRTELEQARAGQEQGDQQQRETIEQLEQQLAEVRQEAEAMKSQLSEAEQKHQAERDEYRGKLETMDLELTDTRQQLTRKDAEKEEADKRAVDLEKRMADLKVSLIKIGGETEQRMQGLQKDLDEVNSLRQRLEEELASSSKRIAELEDNNQRLQQGAESGQKKLHDEMASLQEQLAGSQAELEQARKALLETDTESNEVRKELAALRAVYAQKESDVSRLQNEIEMLKGKVDQGQANDDELSRVKQHAEEQLHMVQQEFQQTVNEHQSIIAKLETDLKVKQQELEEVTSTVKSAESQRKDAENAYQVMEDELEQARQEADKAQADLESSHDVARQLKERLEAVKKENQDWRDKHNDAANGVEMEFLKSRVSELETQLRDSQAGMAEARDNIDRLEKDLVIERHKTDKGEGMDTRIEDLKREMEKQLERYKSELDGDTSRLRKENEKLRDELLSLHKEHEVAIATGRQSSKQETNVSEPASPGLSEKELRQQQAALFDVQDIDKNMFQNEPVSHRRGPGMLMVIFLVLLFSLGSAAGVYWYFVYNKQGVSALPFVDSGAEKEADKAVPVSESPESSKAATAKSGDSKKPASKPLFNLGKGDQTKEASGKQEGGDELLKPVRVFRDFIKSGGNAPVMVAVPAGSFTMGSPSSSTNFNERPEHQVTLGSFAISKHEVTFAEYDRFAAATGRPRPSDSGWGRGKRPVVNVSWKDAVAYAKWLSKETGHVYRLPSEAEWEYSARAGTTTRYWWGFKVGKNNANCFNCGSQWDRVSTAPVGSFAANSLGLHDMTGNVMEWVADCYHKNYQGAPDNGEAWIGGTCQSYVARGGSYRSTADNIRVTKRSEFSANDALDQIGFRVVRVR